MFLSQIRPALSMMVIFTAITGLAYPLAITGVAQMAMPFQANGSQVIKDGKTVGSSLIGQNFSGDQYFWPRPSVTADAPYNAAASTGSNLGTTSAALKDRVATEIKRLNDAGIAGSIPADGATASGSGLDPDISPAFAAVQVIRIAQARGLPEEKVNQVLNQHTQIRLLGFIGEPCVNVLEINLALDGLSAGQ